MFFIYLLKSIGISFLFLCCYELFLKTDTFFTYNRWFLCIGLLTSVVLPAIYFTKTILLEPLVSVPATTLSYTVKESIPTSSFDSYYLLGIVYLSGVLVLSIKLGLELLSLKKLISKGKTTKKGNVTVVKTTLDTSPFSFFNYIIYNPKNYSSNQLSIIIAHEKVHIDQKHSFDIVAAQLVQIFQWFNPLIWRYKKAIEQNLEFIADTNSAEIYSTKQEYQHLLVKSNIHKSLTTLGNSFYNSLIKKRIIMLNKTESPKINLVKYSFVIPMLVAFILFFNVKTVIAQNTSIRELVKDEAGKDNMGTKIRATGTSSDKKPLYIIDGEEASERIAKNIAPENIESMSVFKDDSALEKYGEQGKNGVIMITLKEKQDDKIKVTGYDNKPEPLFIVNGEVLPDSKMEDLNQKNIKSMNVIKGQKAINKYGKKAENGAIEITTKLNHNFSKTKPIEFIIRKNTSNKKLLKLKSELNEHKIDFSYTIARNDKGEIVSLQLQLTSETGSLTSNFINTINGIDQPIEPAYYFVDPANKILSSAKAKE